MDTKNRELFGIYKYAENPGAIVREEAWRVGYGVHLDDGREVTVEAGFWVDGRETLFTSGGRGKCSSGSCHDLATSVLVHMDHSGTEELYTVDLCSIHKEEGIERHKNATLRGD